MHDSNTNINTSFNICIYIYEFGELQLSNNFQKNIFEVYSLYKVGFSLDSRNIENPVVERRDGSGSDTFSNSHFVLLGIQRAKVYISNYDSKYGCF